MRHRVSKDTLTLLTHRNSFIHTRAALAIGFDTANYTVRELEGNVSVQVVKVGENERPVSVLFSTLNGTATGVFTYIVYLSICLSVCLSVCCWLANS